ncbi:TonB-dependent receptor plug domain-containing protein, partial [Algoriphagus sp. D3-2-R+10]|uniref:TonB-dependent receptor plug domain-containing protein n=1 Tax=Algoriphagus aurantiacus TaxID=3103948 RepID=UPI002B3A3171
DQLILGEVEVVSTGYQEIPRERASGSFVQLGQEMVNRRVSTNILDRLQDITPGLIFNRFNESQDPISIRGRSTIFANTTPLVVVDNFPYDGPLENINPNDVESFTILRDAAAASIWGARAGNGVIVITTKKGKSGSAPKVSLNTNLIFTEKPDLFYSPRMDNSDFVEVERM